MSAQHTAGPWEAIKGVVESDEMRCGVTAVRGDMRYLVATIENGVPGDFCDTEFANACLIAAAPMMLTLLEELIDIEGPQPGHVEWYRKVRAAITEARGGA